MQCLFPLLQKRLRTQIHLDLGFSASSGPWLHRILACHVSRWIRLSKSLVGSTSGCSQTSDRCRHSNFFPEPSLSGKAVNRNTPAEESVGCEHRFRNVFGS